ncbi:MAG: hypothetical protein OEW00_07605, partial [candidate division Zixibacteria bacterium]|nr:hypothetical protein [candidate division Zixibacteria bacterium]
MMKHAATLLVILLVLTSIAFAQDSRKYQIFVDGQGLFLTEPDFWTDYYSFGIGVGGGIEYPVSPSWSLIGGIDIRTYALDKGAIEDAFKEDYNASSVEVSGGRAWGYSFSVLGKGMLHSEGSRMTPYFKGGFGLTHITASDAEVKYTVGNNDLSDDPGIESETNVSITLGVGL